MALGPTQTPPHSYLNPSEVCILCASSSYTIYECPSATQFPEFVQEQANAAYSRPGNDPYSNTYNPGWRSHPNFSWQPHTQGNSFPQNQRLNNRHPPNQSTYQPNHQQQFQHSTPPPQNKNTAFEEKVLQALQGLESTSQAGSQLMNSHI